MFCIYMCFSMSLILTNNQKSTLTYVQKLPILKLKTQICFTIIVRHNRTTYTNAKAFNSAQLHTQLYNKLYHLTLSVYILYKLYGWFKYKYQSKIYRKIWNERYWNAHCQMTVYRFWYTHIWCYLNLLSHLSPQD